MTVDATNDAREQAKAQLEGIREMLARLKHAESCDGDADTCELLNEIDCPFPLPGTEKSYETSFTDYHDAESARDAIREDALGVEVRSGWVGADAYADRDAGKPAEFNILLCTGGPAVRIMGELDNYGNPERAWLEYQDWGTPWVELIESDTMDKRNALLEYASHYLGY